MIGASPDMGGLRGSSSGGSAIECRAAGEGKNELLGNSRTLGEKSAGVGGVSTSDPPKLREKFWRGELVISVRRGDIRASHSWSSLFGKVISCLDGRGIGAGGDAWKPKFEGGAGGVLKPKSKPPSLVIAESIADWGSGMFSVLLDFSALSRAEMLGVEFPRPREGVVGVSATSAERLGLCLTVVFLIVLLFSAFSSQWLSWNRLMRTVETYSDLPSGIWTAQADMLHLAPNPDWYTSHMQWSMLQIC